MLWLAGLMGLMAVGAVTFVEPQVGEEDEDGDSLNDTATTFDGTEVQASGLMTQFDVPEDNIEPDYDPRGGDDVAIRSPLDTLSRSTVTLTEGSDDDETLFGDDGDDRIRGQAGSDTLDGGSGDDELRGDEGADELRGGTGNDTLHGQDGQDYMSGGDQNDVLFGHNADDTLHGDEGDDALQGSAGYDLLDGGIGNDTLNGGLDNDTLIGGAGSDVLFGGWGNDVLNGIMRDASTGIDQDEADFLNGGGGDDSILAGAGDFVTAGGGADEIVLGDWITEGEAAEIFDYTADDDSLVLIWDDSSAIAIEPQITMSPDPDGADQTQIFMDGTIVAIVNGIDLVPSDIALIPLSTATQVGLTS